MEVQRKASILPTWYYIAGLGGGFNSVVALQRISTPLARVPSTRLRSSCVGPGTGRRTAHADAAA